MTKTESFHRSMMVELCCGCEWNERTIGYGLALHRSASDCDNLQIFGGDFGGTRNHGSVVGRLKCHQIPSQRGFSVGVERGKRLLSRAIVLAEELHRLVRRKRVAHQGHATGEAHVG